MDDDGSYVPPAYQDGLPRAPRTGPGHTPAARIVPNHLGGSSRACGARGASVHLSDFSVVRFRPHFMLVSEERHMKPHKNQWLWARPYSPEALVGFQGRGFAEVV